MCRANAETRSAEKDLLSLIFGTCGMWQPWMPFSVCKHMLIFWKVLYRTNLESSMIWRPWFTFFWRFLNYAQLLQNVTVTWCCGLKTLQYRNIKLLIPDLDHWDEADHFQFPSVFHVKRNYDFCQKTIAPLVWLLCYYSFYQVAH